MKNKLERPPLGVMPKDIYYERIRIDRFNDLCGAISRYYDAGMKINVDWIIEYNELVDYIGKDETNDI